MSKIEKIRGDAIKALFKELQQGRIPLKTRLMNGDYEHVTYVIDIHEFKRIPFFLIESQESFQKAADDLDVLRLRFEYIGKDRIKYTFKTSDTQISNEKIWIRFPESVLRFQRRRLFRLDAPHGTRLYFNVNDVRYKLLVVNVSLGGTLGVLVSLTKEMEQELKMLNPKILTNVELVFPPKGHTDGSKVNIKTCHVARQGRNRLTQKYECAMEFKEMAEDEQKRLTELFYWWQREYLRKRKLFKV
jgi:c-di-GMP-binding flagellar brake protein YcgR